MNTFLFNPFLIPIAAIVGYFGVKAIVAVSGNMAQMSKHRAENELKIVLAQRGMSAEEIIRVVSASSTSEASSTSDASSLAETTCMTPGGHVVSHASAPLPPDKNQPVRHYAYSQSSN